MLFEEHIDRNCVSTCGNDTDSEDEEDRFLEAFRAFDKDCDGFLRHLIT